MSFIAYAFHSENRRRESTVEKSKGSGRLVTGGTILSFHIFVTVVHGAIDSQTIPFPQSNLTSLAKAYTNYICTPWLCQRILTDLSRCISIIKHNFYGIIKAKVHFIVHLNYFDFKVKMRTSVILQLNPESTWLHATQLFRL